jgi:prepilin-type processing-associated H-X9-DG protein
MAPAPSGNAECMKNGKYLALAAMMFMADNENKFAFTDKNYRTKLEPYLKNKGVYTCPLDKAGTISYSFNSALSGINSSRIKDPSRTVMFYEGKGKVLRTKHQGGRATVAFCDGSVRLVPASAAKSLVWKP